MERAIERVDDPYTPEEVAKDIASGHAKAFTTDDSLMVLTINEHNGVRTAVVWLAAGDLGEIRGQIKDEAEDWARSKGCEFAEIHGRRGWTAALPDYRESAVILRKKLTDG